MINFTNYFFDNNQRTIRDEVLNSKKDTVILAARQTFKTTTVLAIAIEELLSKKDITIVYVAPRRRQSVYAVSDAFRVLLKYLREEDKPKFEADTSTWVFPTTGSRLEISGFNHNEVEQLRGSRVDRIILDDFCFMNDLSYGIMSVLRPKLNLTNGYFTMISHLPILKNPDFYTIIDKAEKTGRLLTRTIYDCEKYTKEHIDRFAESYGGYDSEDFKRNMLNVRTNDK